MGGYSAPDYYRMLKSVCEYHDEGTLSGVLPESVQSWWSSIAAAKQKQERKEALYKSAMAKLTKEEREALGDS